MEWLKKNILTVTLLLFALGAFLTELAGSLPPGVASEVSQTSIIVIGAARGLVVAMEVLKSGDDS